MTKWLKRGSLNVRKRTNTKIYKSVILAAVFLLIFSVAAGCSNGKDASIDSGALDDTVKIGIYEPLSGADKDAARAETIGIELAHKLHPSIAGKKIELIYADNKSDLLHGKLAAQKLVNEDVDIVLGSYGNIMSMTGGEYFQKAGIPVIAITCTNPLVTKGNTCYFRIGTIDSFQAVMAAKYVYNELPADVIAILKQEDDDYGTALAQQFSDKLVSLAELGNEDPVNIQTEEYDADSEDFKRQLTRIKQSGAKAIYLPCPPEKAAQIARQARKLGVDALFIGTDLWHDESFIDEGGEAVEGAVFTDYFDSSAEIGQKSDEFLSAYRAEYGDESPDSAVALGFDAYLVALHAMQIQNNLQSVDNKRVSLCDALASVKEYMGVTGSITFDENGDPIKPVVLTTVVEGEFKHCYTAEPEWNHS